MAIETVGTHLADLRESRARSGYYESATQERQAMLPGKLKKQEIDIDTARLLYGELEKDAVLSGILREINVDNAEALRTWTNEQGPAELVGRVALQQSVEEMDGEVKLAMSKSELIRNQLSALIPSMKNHFLSMSDPNYNSEMGQAQIESMFENAMTEFERLNIAERNQESGLLEFPGLPQGAFQGEKLKPEDIPQIQFVHDSAMSMSTNGQKLLLEREKNQPTQADFTKQASDEFKLLDQLKSEIQTRIMPGFTAAYDVNTEKGGMRDKEGWGTANETLNSALSQMVQRVLPAFQGDPQGAVDAVSRVARENMTTYEGSHDPWGPGDHSYNTYVPTQGSGWKNREEYINQLETFVKQQIDAGYGAQSSADRFLESNIPDLFTNMVTQ